jgi:hypothetical protein
VLVAHCCADFALGTWDVTYGELSHGVDAC